MKCAGLLYDDSPHYLDHLAPFCILMGWPLIICDEALATLAQHYYPSLQVIQREALKLSLPSYTLTCDNKPLLEAAFPGQTTPTIWLPHGNSDKGIHHSLFEALQREDLVLVYGPKMIDFIHSQNLHPPFVQIGNFRYQYYLQNRPFYDALCKKTLPPSYFLYAPTWDDYEASSSFWAAFPSLATSLPSTSHLVVKLHPNTLKKHETEIEVIQGKYSRQKNILFLSEFPPIYPLLNGSIAYIGDRSSIGYDFLSFDRPLYFLNANPELYLSQCGTAIDPKRFSFSQEDGFSLQRKKAYEYTFHPELKWEQKIAAFCRL